MTALATVARGSLRPGVTVTWTHADGTTPEVLTGATITGWIKDLSTDEVRAIQGTFTVTDAANGVFTWVLDPLDVATEGTYEVQFAASFASSPTPARTAVFTWEVAPSLADPDSPGEVVDYQGVVRLLVRTTNPDNPAEDYMGLFVKDGALYLIDEDGNVTAFDDGTTAAAAAVSAHVGESDPHTQYLTEAAAASTYSGTAHTHAGYSASDHTHDYSGTFAPTSHSHDYAATAHSHSGYAADDHSHAGYSTTDHTHAGYAATGHDHSGTYATAAHSHDYSGTYAALVHNHDGTYSAAGHNHDSAYAATGHTHDYSGTYAASAHNHDSAYSATGHNHDAAYISVIGTPTEGNIPTITAGGELTNSAYAPSSFATSGHNHTGTYATAGHDHTGVYSASGHTHDYAASAHTHAYVAESLIDAKGDLIVGSADNTVARLAVGTNGQHLAANSAATNGVEWVAVTRYLTLGVPGTLTAAAGTVRLYVPFACTVTNVRASVGTAPTGASLIVDVLKNGTTIFSTTGNRPTITATNFTDLSSTPDVTAIAADDYLTISVAQIGSTVAGADLVVTIVVTVP